MSTQSLQLFFSVHGAARTAKEYVEHFEPEECCVAWLQEAESGQWEYARKGPSWGGGGGVNGSLQFQDPSDFLLTSTSTQSMAHVANLAGLRDPGNVVE
jgi:hypothetical protein